MKNRLQIRIDKKIKLYDSIDKKFFKDFNSICTLSKKALKNGKKIISFGNGGSAADSIHFTGELVAQYKIKRNSLPAISLNSNVSVITSIGNDLGYEKTFSRQLEGLYNSGDFVIGLSTSGNSKNVLHAINYLNKIKANYFILSGKNGGKCKCISKNILIVPSMEVDIIQEMHYMILHSLCDHIESK